MGKRLINYSGKSNSEVIFLIWLSKYSLLRHRRAGIHQSKCDDKAHVTFHARHALVPMGLYPHSKFTVGSLNTNYCVTALKNLFVFGKLSRGAVLNRLNQVLQWIEWRWILSTILDVVVCFATTLLRLRECFWWWFLSDAYLLDLLSLNCGIFFRSKWIPDRSRLQRVARTFDSENQPRRGELFACWLQLDKSCELQNCRTRIARFTLGCKL